MTRVAGIDRWRKGWIVAAEATDGSAPELFHCDDIEAAAADLADADVVAIDLPLSLPQRGRRPAEVELRRFLGRSARSVFDSPTRQAIESASQAEATRVNRELDGPGISAQSWGLSGSIREARGTLIGHPAAPRWWETHPESAFTVMNGDEPPPPKKSAVGVAVRLGLLRAVFGDVDTLLLDCPAGVPIDDALDALAALWSARRIRDGEARLFGTPERDDEGLPVGVRI